jgi:TolB-like protein
MKIYFTILLTLFGITFSNAQSSKVAILDFENTSGKTEYDALGKAISSMLITDLANNIHPKKVEFFERSQLNKLLDEQKLQKSKNFDAKTAVDFGKLSGVNYVFVGSVFILDGTCNFSSKLVDVQTSKILLAKDVSGKIEAWLQLKTQLAESIANQLNSPINLDVSYKDQITSLATINQYGKILTTMDGGDMDKAEQMRSLFEETNPDFKYFKDIKADIELLKERIAELENVTGLITNSFSLGVKAIEKFDYINSIKYFKQYLNSIDTSEYSGNKKLYAFTKMAYAYLKLDSNNTALNYTRNALKYFKYYPEALEIEIVALKRLGHNEKAQGKISFLVGSLNLMLEIDNFPENYNCSYIESFVSAYNFGTTTKKTGEIPNQILWYLVYNQSKPGLNKWGLKFSEEDYACFYNGIEVYGYDSRYQDNSIKLNSLIRTLE